MWAPDAAYKDGTYYLYFPAKDHARRVPHRRRDVQESRPARSTPRPEPIKGSFSIDPAVFTDDDGQTYMYFGGLSGGQLQMNVAGVYDPNGAEVRSSADGQPALTPEGRDAAAGHARVRREARATPSSSTRPASRCSPATATAASSKPSWMHKYNGKYYFSYSTGGTHFIAYATGDSPYGPFTYQRQRSFCRCRAGRRIIRSSNSDGRWWLFYADTQLSDKTWLRNVKVTELFYNPDGTIQTIDPFIKD